MALRKAKVETDSDLAQLLIADIKAETSAPPIFSRGHIWKYNHDSGIWQAQATHDVKQALFAYHRRIATPKANANRTLTLSNGFVESAVKAMETLCYHKTFFDSPPLGVAFTNGFLEVTATGVRLVAHDCNHRANFGLAFEYAPKTKPVAFLAFLREVFRDDEDAEEKIQTLQQFLAASLLGICTRFQQCLVFWGRTGNNGKSLIIHIFKALMPTALTSVPPQKWSEDYFLAELAHSRLNAVGELPDAEFSDASAFKAVIAGDEVTAREITKPPFAFTPVAGHVFSVNKLPPSKDTTDAFFRRFLMLTFNRHFDGTTPASEILTPIKAELAAIAAWALSSAPQLLQQNGYTKPPSALEAVKKWRSMADSVAAFVETCCHRNATAPCQEVFTVYRDWCREMSVAQLTFPKFTERMEILGLASKRGKTGFVYPVGLLTEESWKVR